MKFKKMFRDIALGDECIIKSGDCFLEKIRKTGYNKGICTAQTGYGNQRGVGHLFTISPWRDVTEVENWKIDRRLIL